MRYVVLLGSFAMLGFLAACKPRPARLPLKEDKLVQVLADVHVAEAALQGLLGRTKDSMANVYYDQICIIHGVDRLLFDSAMQILQEDPERMERIYAEVMKEMERLDAAVGQ
jgi:hypothetical protein